MVAERACTPILLTPVQVGLRPLVHGRHFCRYRAAAEHSLVVFVECRFLFGPERDALAVDGADPSLLLTVSVQPWLSWHGFALDGS